MQKIKVPFSTNVAEIGHDDKQTLYVRFSNGGEYLYENFSAEKFEEFKKAKSKGGYHAKEIRNNPDHPCTKIGQKEGE